MIKLIGVLIVLVGFALKRDTIATVVVAGLVTGLVAGMSAIEILDVLGQAFITNRTATLFVLTLPVIGICERYGLKDKAIDFIRGIKNATVGKVLSIYLAVRSLASAFSIRLGGHPQFVRPIVEPMAEGAALSRHGELTEKDQDEVKGASAAMENYGNFFAQNCFMGASGTLLIVTTLNEQLGEGAVNALQIAMASIPVAVICVLLGVAQNLLGDWRRDKRLGVQTGAQRKGGGK